MEGWETEAMTWTTPTVVVVVDVADADTAVGMAHPVVGKPWTTAQQTIAAVVVVVAVVVVAAVVAE